MLRIGVGHGQMGEAELERVLLGFMRHEYDVFVCTTIVENGLDIPLANTMIIENAERYGLVRAVSAARPRRPVEPARLRLPAGTRRHGIERRRAKASGGAEGVQRSRAPDSRSPRSDLELRGAGNLLGGEQHGHIGVRRIRYILAAARRNRAGAARARKLPPEIHATLNLGLDIRIPSEYIADEHQRLRAYKRIAEAKSETMTRNGLPKSLQDRYGPPPEAVINLLRFSVLKTVVERAGVEAIDRRTGMLNIKFHTGVAASTRRSCSRSLPITKARSLLRRGCCGLPLTGLDTPEKMIGYLTRLFS